MKLVVLDGYTENPGDLSWAELAALGELTASSITKRCMKALLYKLYSFDCLQYSRNR